MNASLDILPLSSWINTDAVSYTHLDVYKRQTLPANTNSTNQNSITKKPK